jgi:DNA-binding ferritin-like protein
MTDRSYSPDATGVAALNLVTALALKLVEREQLTREDVREAFESVASTLEESFDKTGQVADSGTAQLIRDILEKRFSGKSG